MDVIVHSFLYDNFKLIRYRLILSKRIVFVIELLLSPIIYYNQRRTITQNLIKHYIHIISLSINNIGFNQTISQKKMIEVVAHKYEYHQSF